MIKPWLLVPEASSPSYEGPLDIVPGAVVAYGQRALSAAKLGTALYTIREDAGDTTQSFNSDAVTGDAPVVAITAFLDGANGFVTVWEDQGSSGSNGIQSTTDQQFEWSASLYGSISAFTLEAVRSTFMATLESVALPGGAYTCFIVANPVGISSYAPFFGENYEAFTGGEEANSIAVAITDDGLTGSFSCDVSSNGGSNEVGGRSQGASSILGTGARIFEACWEFGSTNLKINGIDKTVTSSFDTAPVGDISNRLGIATDDAVSPYGYWDGTYAELIIYSSILSDANRLAIRQNIATYYGITLS